jgi:hydroxymethylbilane synthase
METENLAGIVLAAAGLNRMGLSALITQILDIDLCLPAVGQGALALEIREEDEALKEMLSCLDHQETALGTQAERSFLKRLQGGCQVPLAGHARFREGRLSLAGLIASVDGSVIIKAKMEGPAGDPEGLGLRLAEDLLDQGGREILDQVYRQEENTRIKQTGE